MIDAAQAAQSLKRLLTVEERARHARLCLDVFLEGAAATVS